MSVGPIDMRVEHGDIYALVGSTGAGKTTVLRMIAGLSRPTDGQIILFDGVTEPCGRVGFYIGRCGIVASMTLLQNMMAKALSLGVVGPEEHCLHLLDRFGLRDKTQMRVSSSTPGQRELLGMALALVGSPDLLLLDESSMDLDPREKHVAGALLEELSQDLGTTIIFAMRSPRTVECRVSRYGVLDHGRLLCELTSEQLEKATVGGMRVRTARPESTIVLLDERMPNAYVRMQPDGSLLVKGCDETELASVLHSGAQPVLELSPLRSTADTLLADLMEGGEHDA